MSASIHIHGTRSSIVDTIFVCRSAGAVPRRWLCGTAHQLVALVVNELADLEEAGCNPSLGDTRCILFGHLTRLAIWRLRTTWDTGTTTEDKMEKLAEAMVALGDPMELAGTAWNSPCRKKTAGPLFSVARCRPEIDDAVSF